MSATAFLAKFATSATGDLIEKVGATIDRFVTTDGEKMELQLALEELLQKRDSEIEETARKELEAKMQIIVAELKQDDKFTKRARPSIIYVGLVVIVFNYALVPAVLRIAGLWHPDINMAPLALPSEFWWAWGGITSTYAVGRSAEKRGIRNKVTNFMTGSKKSVIENFLGGNR